MNLPALRKTLGTGIKRAAGPLSPASVLFLLLIVFFPSAEAAPSDLRTIADKLGVDFKKIPPVILKFATMAPADTPWMKFPLDHIVKKIKEESEGAVRIQIFAGEDDVTILKKMTSGQFLGCGCTSLGINGAIPETSVFSLPLLFRNYDEVDHIMKKFRKDIIIMFSKKGYRLFSIIDTGFLYLFTKDEVSSMDDMRKHTVANWQGEIEKMTLDELKVRSTAVLVPDLYASLKTGLIHGSITPPGWELATQSFLFIHYFVNTPFFYSLAAVMADEKQIKELERAYPPGFIKELTEYISSEMIRVEKEWRGEIREFEKKCIQAFVSSGRVPVSLSQADMDALHAAALNVKRKLAGKLYSEEFLSKVETELVRYRKQAGESKKP